MSQSNRVNFPIDLVYLWVDDKDPVWREKRNKYLNSNIDTSNNNASRWCENDELKYSLRSVEKYAPWINHIYIVTDNQCPQWLDVNHPKIDIVDHSQILDKEALPIFNSSAIESRIHRIPNLGEHFIMGNDDTLFVKPVDPEHFFQPDGTPIIRLNEHKFHREKAKKSGNNYKQILVRMQDLISDKFGANMYHAPHHNFDAYRLSHFKESIDIYPEQWNKTSYNRFREHEDMHRSFVSYYAIVTGKATLRKVGRYNRTKGVLGAVKALLTNRFASDSRCIPLTIKDYQAEMRKYNPLMICMNDGEGATDNDRRRMVAFLNNIFPNKSSFEK